MRNRNSTTTSHSKCWRCKVPLDPDNRSIWDDTCADCYYDVVEYKFEQEELRREHDEPLVS